jgi:hypothetical protein
LAPLSQPNLYRLDPASIARKQVTRKFLSKHYRQEMPAGSVNRKKGIDASVDMGEIKNGDSVSVFIIQVTALSRAATQLPERTVATHNLVKTGLRSAAQLEFVVTAPLGVI